MPWPFIVLFLTLLILALIRFLCSSRFYWFYLIFLTLVLIIGRFACSSLECFFYLPQIYLFNDRSHPLPDWELRSGVDEAGLILTGFLIVLLILWKRNISPAEVYNRITKLNVFGVAEIDLLNQKVDNYISKFENELTAEDLSKISKDDELTIHEASTIDERLDLINNLILSKLRSMINSVLFSKINYFRPQPIIAKLKETGLLDKDLISILSHYFSQTSRNYVNLKGALTLGLIEVGRKLVAIINFKNRKTSLKSFQQHGDLSKDIKIRTVTFNEVNNEEAIATTSIVAADENNNLFPVNKLKKSNFKIFELSNGVQNKVNILSVDPISDTKVRLNLIILLDCSPSMEKEQRFFKSKESILHVLKSLSNQAETVASNILWVPFFGKKTSFSSTWYNLQNDYTKLYKLVQNQQLHESTPLIPALIHSLDQASQNTFSNGLTFILNYTDGEGNHGNELTSELFARLKNGKTPIFSIGYSGSDENLLKKLAILSNAGEINNGYFLDVDPLFLRGVVDKIINTIKGQYRIKWQPIDEFKGKRDVLIKVSYVSQTSQIIKNEIWTSYSII